MAAVEMPERGSFKARPATRCAGCPFAGLCTPCRPQTSGTVLVVRSIEELLRKQELPRGIIYFSSARQGSGEPLIIRRNEKTCSKCPNNATTCSHQEELQAA